MGFVVAAIAAVITAVTGASAIVATTIATVATRLLVVGAILYGAARLSERRGEISFATQKQADTKQRLQFPTSRPAIRHIHGETAVGCTPLPWPKYGNREFCAWLVQSRPSVGEMRFLFDNREIEFDDTDPYDFSGPGARSLTPPLTGAIRLWIGRGDQTSPPQEFLDNAGPDKADKYPWLPTDAGQGCTIIFAYIWRGNSQQRAERWPNPIPQLTVQGKITPLWDPRDPEQSFDDPSSWTYSDNWALAVLDVALNNPVRPHLLEEIDIDSFIEAANRSDDLVPTRSEGLQKRYTVGGVTSYESVEIEDILEPLVMCGAGALTRQGGLLGLRAGVYETPQHVVRNTLDDVFDFSTEAEGDDKPTEARGVYSPLERPLETAETPTLVFDVEAGAAPRPATYQLPYVNNGARAQRIVSILANQERSTKRLGIVGPPEDIQAVAGAPVQVDFPAPFGAFVNGEYLVESANPMLDPLGEDGVALRIGLQLRETGPDVYAWDAATQEQEIIHPEFDGFVDALVPPSNVTASTGPTANRSTGDTIIPRIRVSFGQSTSVDAMGYEIQAGPAGADDWPLSATVSPPEDDLEGISTLVGYVDAEAGVLHDVRVRTTSVGGASDWVLIENVLPVVSVTLQTPDAGVATGGAGRIDLTFDVPFDDAVVGFEIWSAAVDDSAQAVLLTSFANPTTGETLTTSETGLGASVTRYYFARTRGAFSAASSFSASSSATTDP